MAVISSGRILLKALSSGAIEFEVLHEDLSRSAVLTEREVHLHIEQLLCMLESSKIKRDTPAFNRPVKSDTVEPRRRRTE